MALLFFHYVHRTILRSLIIYFVVLQLLLKTTYASSATAQSQTTTIKSNCPNQEKIANLIEDVKRLTTESGNLNQKLQFVEDKNSQQDSEIESLKSALASIQNGLLLNEQGNNEYSVASTDDKYMELDNRRGIRPARLLPLQLIRPVQNESTVIGVPSNCDELNALGHTVNGIYLVKFESSDKKNTSRKQNSRIEAVFCDFNPHNTKSSKRLGILDIKSSPGVYFYVVRDKMVDDDMAKTIRFNKELLNIGNAMDVTTGLFIAPTPGIYQFSFSVTKDGYVLGEVYVHLRLNNKNIGLAISNNGFYAGLASFQSILALKKGDRIDLYKYKGKINSEMFNICHFTGMMLEENITDKI